MVMHRIMIMNMTMMAIAMPMEGIVSTDAWSSRKQWAQSPRRFQKLATQSRLLECMNAGHRHTEMGDAEKCRI